jgi:uncharacterized phage protein gp47/JayE
MAYIPTTQELYNNISNDLKNKLNLSNDELKKVLDAVAMVLAGQLKLFYLSLSDIQNNVFPDTADSTENGGTLDRHGMIQLNRLQRPATNGVFQVSVSAVIGSQLRSGLTFKSNDNSLNPGNIYILDTSETIVSNPQIIEIRSIQGGTENNLEIGNELTITEPVIGVNQIVTVSAVTEQPLAAESEADYRKAIIDSIQLEPQGGSKTDYRLWSLDAQGVRSVYPFIKDGEAGTIQIFVEATVEDSDDGYGTPGTSILENVNDVINFDPDITKPLYERGRKPIQANLEVLPISLNPVDVEIVSLTENNLDIQNAIRENIVNYLKDIRPFVAGGDLARNKNDILYASRIQSTVTDILDASNSFNNLIVLVDGVQQNSYLFSRENIPYLRNLTFSS